MPEDVAQVVEVFLQDQSYALRGQRVAGEIAVVGLVVDAEGDVAAREEEVTDVEVADEGAFVFRHVVAVAELSVEEEAIVEHASGEHPLVFGVVEALVAGGDVGSEVPVVVFHDVGQHGVDLLRECPREEALHGECRAAVFLVLLCRAVVVGLRIEASYGEQVEHLLVEFLF